MAPYNEADTRAKLIDPQIKLSGWGETQIEREHYFVKGEAVTSGRIYLIGEESRRRQPWRVDYLLRYKGQMIAVLEAKDETKAVDAGLEQAKSYAKMLDVPFAYSSNGHGFVEFDFFSNQSCELSSFPAPEQLWNRWENYRRKKVALTSNRVADVKGTYITKPLQQNNPLLHPFCSAAICGKEPRYFQEVAIRRVIERMITSQKRILLTMATGTGKTFTAFQIVWKLRKSGWLKKPILFIADRIPLRNQAYNAFSPFANTQADPRGIIRGGKFNYNRDLYFALYQALDAEDNGKALFKSIPPDFFGLIIIDECHRSGFGKWNAILQHFSGAIQLGMTATPKQSESIDTYAYFCCEEPEIPLDYDDPSKGNWQPPAYSYSLGQGIEDGFLATYKVHKVRTSVDKDGLHVEDAQVQGAEIYVPENSRLRDTYLTPQFEREITLPDRTETMVKHLAGLLNRFGAIDKTMVFCVDMSHARLVARLLQNEFSSLGYSDYAVPIIAEEGEASTWLEQFQDSDRRTPVVATTAELLSTGVDVPSCRNIVFMKPISSPILFKQIIGRGSRVDSTTGKEWFRIIDYVGASRLFDEWDRPPEVPTTEITGPRTSILEGTVLHAVIGDLIVGAAVTVLIGANQQLGPLRTNDDGYFRFEHLPAGTLRLSVTGTKFRPRTVTVETEQDITQTVVIELKPQEAPIGKISVRGLEVTIADEATFLVESTGEQLTLEQYLDYTKAKVVGYVPKWSQLYEIWTDANQREAFLEELEAASIHIEVLAEVLSQPKADQFDLLAHLAFNKPVHTRDERVEAFLNYEQRFLEERTPEAREVILALLDKYRLAGVQEMFNQVFRLSPFREMGQAPGIVQRFGTINHLRQTLNEVQSRLYQEETG
ncbi:restriction endonuclease subunit R [Nostoc sp. CENA543]|uniref:EcoAI/FtnUII family type I restriction enzme subunit R n=1 Tax=Nostoc sp. CENA543 TaxID=1869241 RepID=UPI000CA3E709|nr:DEAD/DEAH box helicase family protein [Nostoc sp. CENA543]AUT02873.1 restriction endonuclease subunit R [Nostoc sp. CENA543]